MKKKLQLKQLLTWLLCAITAPSAFAQDLFFEQSNGTATTFGKVDVYQSSSSNLITEIGVNSSFDKTEGWELVALDGTDFYYQITDIDATNYGQIDIWNNKTETRTNYGNLSDIFETPTYWTLGGADDGKLYFASRENNSEIVSWDGNTLSVYGYLTDVVRNAAVWRFAGFHNGSMYMEWSHASTQANAVRSWDKETDKTTNHNRKNYYSSYDDAYLFGVTDYVASDNINTVSLFESIQDHIEGTTTLSASELESAISNLSAIGSLFVDDYDVINTALKTIALYESNYGGLFTLGSTTKGGFSRTASGYELENVMLVIMQSIMDYSYTSDNLAAYPELFNNTLFKTSEYFPGAVAQPTDPTESFTIQINGTHVRKPGTQANYETEDARRPTGTYLAPGSVATVTVPSSLVGIGASILVGAHTWDLTQKTTIKRMDRVTTKYEITSTTVKIANPLGGGIYINVPYQKDLGIIDITLKNVVRSPYYARTAANTTSLTDWKNTERLRDVPWTDIETEKVMMQVPTSWVSAYDDIETAMDDWDLSMDAISELVGRPLLRSKTVIYMQVDVIKRGTANFPGYPQSNVEYNPFTNYGGYKSNYLIDGPRDARGYLPNVLFHEQGHAEKIYKFPGEIESMVNFLWVAVYNKKFGVELNEAFRESFNGYGLNHTLEEAAISWMIAENFRLGNEMSRTTGQYRQEFSYQPRGHAKYADIVRLFDWEALESHYENTSELYENGEINYDSDVNNVPTDQRLLRMSQAAGYDLRPLIHFWGVHPDNFNNLETEIQNSDVKKSTAIYDQLSYYKTIVPIDNTAFRNFGLEDYSESKITNSSTANHGNVAQSYYEVFLNKFWNSYSNTESQAIIAQIQTIIDLYFPDGRPEEDSSSCLEVTPVSVESSSSVNPEYTLDDNPATVWTAQGDGEYLLYDLGELYDLCDLEINFENGLTRFDYFDIQVSRDNQTYLEVMQDLSSSKTTGSYDTYSVSRKARYIKIICRGNETNDWNSISDVKFYFKLQESLSVEDNKLANSNNISLSPVPTKNILNISGVSLDNTAVEIYNISGVLIESTIINSASSSIDTSSLPTGIYFLKMNVSNNSVVKKFVIMK